MVQIAFSEKYLESLNRLTGEEQKQANKAVLLFQKDPGHSGLNYEKLTRFRDKKLRSIRVNQDVRIILSSTDQETLYLFLNIGHHQEIYKWAESRKVDINPNTGTLQVYNHVEVNVDEYVAQKHVGNLPGLFDLIKKKQLLQLGVPESAIDLVYSMKIEADLENAREDEQLPQEAYEALFMLLAGATFDEAYGELVQQAPIEPVDTTNYLAALSKPQSRQLFMVAENEHELEKVLSESIEKWRVFLHPLQRKLAEGCKNGPVRVLGGAGTGKTVVAMHRAKWLAANVAHGDQKVLFTTFTKNLATDIRQNLSNICSEQELARIEVINLDAWVMSYLKKQGYDYTLLLSNSEEENMWQFAMGEKPAEIDLSLAFFKEEWSHVVQPLSLEGVDDYKRASRIGRGTRLSREQRVAIWPVFAEYRKQLNRNQYKETDDAYRDASLLMQNNHDKRPGYVSVIVDEAQDMGTQAFHLIRAMVAEGQNDLFIVGDGHQRIYGKNKVVLSRCGIDIRGRSAQLKINYRTTDETRKKAVSVLAGIDIDDLDGGLDSNQFYHSLMHGPEPQVSEFESFDAQASGIKKLIDNFNCELNACCVIARTNKEVQAIEAAMIKQGISTCILDGRPSTASRNALNLATMHRVKGLEFDYVIMASVNEGLVPLEFVLNQAGDPVTRRQKENEERALIYVSMTRARKQVFVLGYGALSHWFS